MYDSKSDYALNKLEPDAIVCKSVTGDHIRLTREDFSSEADFQSWKTWSDQDYKETENAGRGYNDKCVSLKEALDSSGLSVEDVLIAALMENERQERRSDLSRQIVNGLTAKQYRRMCLYYLEGMTEDQIAAQEGVAQQRVSKSLVAGKRAVEKIFQNFLGNRG